MPQGRPTSLNSCIVTRSETELRVVRGEFCCPEAKPRDVTAFVPYRLPLARPSITSRYKWKCAAPSLDGTTPVVLRGRISNPPAALRGS